MDKKNTGEDNKKPDDVIHWRIQEWFPKLPKDIYSKLKTYHSELLRFNKTVNLISAKSIFAADNTHFADCIHAVQIIGRDPEIDTLYDFGSGNGFPGLVFAVFYPKVQVRLVESDQRKSEFLKPNMATITLNIKTLVTNLQPMSVSRRMK